MTGAMTLEEALEAIRKIAERYERDMRLCEMAARTDRERQKRASENDRQAASAGTGA